MSAQPQVHPFHYGDGVVVGLSLVLTATATALGFVQVWLAGALAALAVGLATAWHLRRGRHLGRALGVRDLARLHRALGIYALVLGLSLVVGVLAPTSPLLLRAIVVFVPLQALGAYLNASLRPKTGQA